MKRSLLLSALLLSSAVMATDYNYEITPVIGYNIAEGNLNLDDYARYGVELQYNGFDSPIKPELSIIGGKADYNTGVNLNKDTKVCRVALNGVYEFDKIGIVTPIAKAGIGYENMSDTYYKNTNSAFIDAGVGAKIPFTDWLALKLETVYMLKNNDNRYDNNLAILAGLNFAFGAKSQPVVEEAPKEVVKKAVVVAPVAVVILDDDRDGIENSQDKCPTTPAGKEVNYDGCCLDLDDDKDGVLNSKDQCPTTPAGNQVDANGCCLDLDNDKDGVLNSEDQCPTTPTGNPVDANGCCLDLDDDKDGVLNSKDICPNTPLGDAVNSDGCPKSVNLHIKFENNSYNVDTASDALIQKYADFLIEHTNYSAKIVGYTDSRGSAAYNQKLSENRANAVKSLLLKKGAPASSLTSAGMGEANPIADNATSNGRAENRRIEAELTKH